LEKQLFASKMGSNAHSIILHNESKKPVIKMRPTSSEELTIAAKTNAALNEKFAPLVNARNQTAPPGENAKYITYSASESTAGYTPATANRVIKMVEAQVDPFEPARFANQRSARNDGSDNKPIVPIVRAPPKKLTAADQALWSVPASMSNWKNPQGYIIPLDKRTAIDGRSLVQTEINDNFAKLAESLLIAERKARVEVESRAMIQKKLVAKEREEREAELRSLAAVARLERGGILPPTKASSASVSEIEEYGSVSGRAGDAVVASSSSLVSYDNDDERDDVEKDDTQSIVSKAQGSSYEARERLRLEHKRTVERGLRGHGDDGPNKRRKQDSAGSGDFASMSADSHRELFDQRLFSNDSGISSGLGGEDAVYSSSWRSNAAAVSSSSYVPRASKIAAINQTTSANIIGRPIQFTREQAAQTPDEKKGEK
jgi:SNW domain-containing protein 1